MIAADVGLRQHLHGQINVLPLEQRDHALACAIVESLDDDGYLRVELEELAGQRMSTRRRGDRRCRSR